MCAEGKTLDEIETKAIGDIDTRPPQSVADNARRALEVRARKPESERGMTAVGIARARDLMNRVRLSEDTIRRMAAYFERHEVDKQGSTWDEQGRGWQAWYGWGGDDGFAWAKRKIEEFDRERERNSERKKKCACGCRCGSISAAEMERKDCGTGEGGFQEGNTCGQEEGGSSDSQTSASNLASDFSNATASEGRIKLNGTIEEVRRTAEKIISKWQGDSLSPEKSLELAQQVKDSGIATQEYMDASASYTLTDGDDILAAQASRRKGETFQDREFRLLRSLRDGNLNSSLRGLSDDVLMRRAAQRAKIVEQLSAKVINQAQSDLPKEMIVFRGMSALSDDSKEFLQNVKVGQSIETGIISTSANASVAGKYAGDVMKDKVIMKITTKKGIVAQADDRNNAQEGYLQEIVLAPKRLVVKSVISLDAETDPQKFDPSSGWGDLELPSERSRSTLIELEAIYE
jgi:hypothetical protein